MFFRAPCGFGKTTLAKELLKNSRARVYETAADKIDFEDLNKNDKWEVLLVDDLQLLQNHDEQQMLCELIRSKTQ